MDVLEQMAANSAPPAQGRGYSIAPGVVINNLDIMGEGMVQVKIPSAPGIQPWARIVGLGGGMMRGFLWAPQINDEVLVAFNANDERDAYLLGGLWNTIDRPPLSIATDFLTKRVLKTGVAPGVGHEIEFDDALQSITITSSTFQKIKIDPLQIQISNLAGTVSVTLDNKTQGVSIVGAQEISLQSTQISIQAVKFELKAAEVNITSAGPCNVLGLPIKLN
jgi:uncharacterized protein involved in type VI secretion and phage assembly